MPLQCRVFKFIKILLLAWSAISAHSATAQTQASQPIPLVVEIAPDVDSVDLSKATYLLEDPEGKLVLDDVRSAANMSRFQLGSPAIGNTTSAWWMRFTVTNPTAQTMTRWFDTGNRTLQEIELFVPDEYGKYHHQSAGSTRPFAERPLAVPAFVFPTELPQKLTVNVYLRVRSTGYLGVAVSPKVWRPTDYQKLADREKAQWLVYLGMAAALALFNLLLFFSIRDSNYLFYVASLLTVVWVVSSVQGGIGSAFEYFWPNSPVFEQTAWTACILASAYAPVLFITRFVGMRSSTPRLHVFLNICIALTFVFIGFQILGTVFNWQNSTRLLQSAFFLGGLPWLMNFIGLACGLIYLSYRGLRSAKFIMLAFTPLFIGATILGIQVNFINSTPSPSMIMWASAMEFIFMSLALADRFNQEKRAKALAQRALVEGLKKSEQELEGKVLQRTQELQAEQGKTQSLLRNMLPENVIAELSATGRVEPTRHDKTTILFTDLSGFTQATSTMPADRLVAELNDIFAGFDHITREEGIEKIKTIGDAYMAVGGLSNDVSSTASDHAMRCTRAALRMVAFMTERNQSATFKWELRVGLHSGPVISGVVGKHKYAFDIWGDAVNIASRMESSGEVGRVNVSAYTYDLIRSAYACDYRGKVSAKGKGDMDMYFVTGERHTANFLEGD